jgi:hypothetical protein
MPMGLRTAARAAEACPGVTSASARTRARALAPRVWARSRVRIPPWHDRRLCHCHDLLATDHPAVEWIALGTQPVVAALRVDEAARAAAVLLVGGAHPHGSALVSSDLSVEVVHAHAPLAP